MVTRTMLNLAAACALALTAAACGSEGGGGGGGSAQEGGQKLSGSITIDGSSTVFPFAQAAAEQFMQENPDVRITVGQSGTGGGFEKFCAGETQISDASRPIKDDEEVPICKKNKVEYKEVQVASDGIAITTNKGLPIDCMTTDQLKELWDKGSEVKNYSEIDSKFPNAPVKLFGAGTDSGTFDYFTEAINGKARASRSDYLATEDDNVVVTGVQGERGALGYFGFSYYEENKDKLKVLAVDSGKGGGCVTPSIATVQANKYKPLSRPLFIYAKRDSFKRPVVAGFFGYLFNNEKAIAQKAGFIALTDRQLKKARYQYRVALKANSK